MVVCCERLIIFADSYELFTKKINPWTIVRRLLTCYLQLPASYYGCLRLTTSWRSVRTLQEKSCVCELGIIISASHNYMEMHCI